MVGTSDDDVLKELVLVVDCSFLSSLSFSLRLSITISGLSHAQSLSRHQLSATFFQQYSFNKHLYRQDGALLRLETGIACVETGQQKRECINDCYNVHPDVVSGAAQKSVSCTLVYNGRNCVACPSIASPAQANSSCLQETEDEDEDDEEEGGRRLIRGASRRRRGHSGMFSIVL